MMADMLDGIDLYSVKCICSQVFRQMNDQIDWYTYLRYSRVLFATESCLKQEADVVLLQPEDGND